MGIPSSIPYRTVAVLENERAAFFLLVVSDFDENKPVRGPEGLRHLPEGAYKAAERAGEKLKVALIYSFGPNEADDGCGLPDASFDVTTLNTLWVDKDLKDHGLIQAFSRTNRILNSVKTYGNIVCFRNLEDRVNHAISLFGVILRLRNVLTAFDDFAEDDTLSPRDEQDYRSVYTDLYQKWRGEKEEAAVINDDLVFEIEPLKQVDINIDYILMLVQKYHDSSCRDKTIIADIERAISVSYEFRNKRDLIEAFVDGLTASDDVTADWQRYIAEAKERELSAIIEEEALDDAAGGRVRVRLRRGRRGCSFRLAMAVGKIPIQ